MALQAPFELRKTTFYSAYTAGTQRIGADYASSPIVRRVRYPPLDLSRRGAL